MMLIEHKMTKFHTINQIIKHFLILCHNKINQTVNTLKALNNTNQKNTQEHNNLNNNSNKYHNNNNNNSHNMLI